MIKAKQCIFINGCVFDYTNTYNFYLYEFRSGSFKLGSQREMRYTIWRFNRNHRYFKI